MADASNSAGGTTGASRLPIPEDGARLLAVDGGGVKGVSALVILENIMERIKEIEIQNGSTDKSDRKPVDYFHLAAGTSTGGLIAVMLFRLRMTVKQCLDQYHTLASSVFAPVILGIAIKKPGIIQALAKDLLWVLSIFTGAVYTKGPLIRAVDAVVKQFPLDEGDKEHTGDARLMNDKAGMMIMCATMANKGESILFRSYEQPEDSLPYNDIAREVAQEGHIKNASITLAARATSAAPFFFPQVWWNPCKRKNQEIVFWDGGLLNNNPVWQLWTSRYDLVGLHDPAPKVKCVLSLGCSFATPKKFERNTNLIMRAITAVSFITNTKAKAHDFGVYAQRMQDRKEIDTAIEYYRFDADTKEMHFAIDDAGMMTKLEDVTKQWIADSKEVQEQLQKCAEAVAGRPMTTA